jgi:hypothetical protein
MEGMRTIKDSWWEKERPDGQSDMLNIIPLFLAANQRPDELALHLPSTPSTSALHPV